MSPLPIASGVPSISGRLIGWMFECHGFLHNAALILPSALFVLYLAFMARASFSKLSNRRSHVIVAYYGFLWVASLFNLCWSLLQAWECTHGKEALWNLLSFVSTSGMLFLEVSLMAFILQGNFAGGLKAICQTFLISGFIVGLDVLFKAICLFGYGIPLFTNDMENTTWLKLLVWDVHYFILAAVYGVVFFMYNSKWRDRLPARPAFCNYITVMFYFNAVGFFSWFVIATGSRFGFWLYIVTVICYHAFYLPLVYVTFLAEFFQEEDLNLDNLYYSEMKDAGFFDADWE